MTKPTVCVYGLGHLAQVTRECLRAHGFKLHEASPDIVWIAIDTPINDDGYGQPEYVRGVMEKIRPSIADNTLVLISSQVPLGFTASVERDWRATQPSLRFAYSPENIRKVTGTGVADFMTQPRVVVGLGQETPREPLEALFAPFTEHIEWMSLESAEMTKHALNGYLALTAAYANELARISVPLGVDPSAVERALRSDPRIGEKAYVKAAGPITGGHLLREVHVLRSLASRTGIEAPIAEAIIESDLLHRAVESA